MGPPILTSFAGNDPDDAGSFFRLIAEDVRHNVRHADAVNAADVPTVLEVLEIRRKLLERALLLELGRHEVSVPPVLGFSLDGLIPASSPNARMLKGLLDAVEECRDRCERRYARYRLEMRLSTDLDASDA